MSLSEKMTCLECGEFLNKCECGGYETKNERDERREEEEDEFR